MAQKARNPSASRRQGFADGMVSQAGSEREDTADLARRQAAFVAARYGLSASQARVVAGLAFCEVRP